MNGSPGAAQVTHSCRLFSEFFCSAPNLFNTGLARRLAHRVESCVGTELWDGLGQVLVQRVPALLLDFALLGRGSVAMSAVESGFFHADHLLAQ